MSDDLISRSVLIQRLAYYSDHSYGDAEYAYGMAVQEVLNAPAEDAVPLVHARWVQEDEDAWRCTRCSAFWIFIDGGPEENGARFCPVCGALMDAKGETKND